VPLEGLELPRPALSHLTPGALVVSRFQLRLADRVEKVQGCRCPADPVVGPAHCGTYVLQAADGGRIVLVLLENEAALEHAEKLVNASELRPDEDPALLPGPDRITTYKVAHAFAPDFTEIGHS
jgi:hypothetical protein